MVSATHFVRAHLATARLAVFAPLSDGLWVTFGIGLRFVRVLILLAIWRALIPAGASVSGFGLGAVLTYTLIAEVFAAQLHVRTPIQGSLWNGAIATRFTWPLPLVGQYAAEMAGDWAMPMLLVSLPLLLLAPVLGIDPLPASAADGALFLLSLVLAMGVGLAIDMGYTVLTVRLNLGPWLLEPVRTVVDTIVSGAWVPLALFPFHLGAVLQWLPFASAASAPLRIYTGTGPAALLMPVQAVWLAVLVVVVGVAWRRSREKVALYGS